MLKNIKTSHWFWHGSLLNWIEGKLIKLTSWIWIKKARRWRKYHVE